MLWFTAGTVKVQLLFVCWADALGRIVLLVFWTVGTNTLKFVLSTLVFLV